MSLGRKAMLGVARRGGKLRAGPTEFCGGICRETMTNVVFAWPSAHEPTAAAPATPRQKHSSRLAGTQHNAKAKPASQ